MQEVKGDVLFEVCEMNFVNVLIGKVLGVQIICLSNGFGGFFKIQFCGVNFVIGLNQLLIVVDGVLMDNFIGVSNNDIDNLILDMGNGFLDINVEDIEFMFVLKGVLVVVFYGFCVGNGVILIIIKKGIKCEGLGIIIFGLVFVEIIFMFFKC